MAIPRHNQPPNGGGSYIIPQLEGECVTIPGSKTVFRILTSQFQSDGTISVISMGGPLADAPGFHHHEKAHDIFMVTKGYLQLWAGDRCRIMALGDFASVPPGVIHNPKTLGPHTETFGLITPGDWIDFFRYVGEPFDGVLCPEFDERSLREAVMAKMKNATKDYDVSFHPKHQGCEVGEWSSSDETLPETTVPYYLRANTAFSLRFGSKFVRLWSFTSGDGIESLIHEAGAPFKGYVLPDQAETVDQSKVQAACEKSNIVVSQKS